MLTIALCDDEPFWREKIAAYLATRDDFACALSSYGSGEALITACQQEALHFDALFLDMEMPGLSGLETARALREMGSETVIVFVTGYSEYAIEGYEVAAFAYLLKPNLDEKLPRVVSALVEKLARQQTNIVVKTNQGALTLDPQTILFCEKSGHYIAVHTEQTVYKTRMSMAAIENLLPSEQFVRCHSSFVVNLAQVRNLTEKKVILQRSGLEVPIGRSFKDDLRKAWTRYLKKEAGL